MTDLDLIEVGSWLSVAYPWDGQRDELLHVASDLSWSGRAFRRQPGTAGLDRREFFAHVRDLHERGAKGIYLAACSLRPETVASIATGGRGESGDSAYLYGIWSDIDIAGPGHKAADLPIDEEAARKIVVAAGLPEPTAWVHSGGGLYAWWLLDTPAPAQDCAELVKAFQAALGRGATALGVHYGTGVSDLARVMRLPGTVNRKLAGQDRACQMLSFDGPRFTLEALAAFVAPPAVSTVPSQPAVSAGQSAWLASGLTSPAPPGSNGAAPHSFTLAQAQTYVAGKVSEFLALTQPDSERGNVLHRLATLFGHFADVPGFWTSEQITEYLYGLAETNGLVSARKDGVAYAQLQITNGLTKPEPGADWKAVFVPETIPTEPAAPTLDRDVAEELRKLRARTEARRIFEAQTAVVTDWAAEILDEDQLDELPDAQPLVAGWLDRDSLARIVGPSGSLKSFIAVDLAVCISAGIGWHGHGVSQGPVLYVVGEGATGVKKRLRACRERYGVPKGGIYVIRRPVQLGGPEWDSFVAHLGSMASQVRPALIIFDTQTRMSIGLDENAAKDQTVILGAMDVLRVATGACVMLIFHTGLGDAKRARGITTVFGGLDAEILVERAGMQVTLSTNKQKDGRDDRTLLLTAKQVDVGSPVITKDPNHPFTTVSEQPTTLVLVANQDTDASGYGVQAPTVTTRDIGRDRMLELIAIFKTHFGAGTGGTRAEVKVAFMALPQIEKLAPETSRKAFNRAWGELEELGRLAKHPSQARYRFVEFDDLFDLEENVERVAPEGWDGWVISDPPPPGKKTNDGAS